MLTDEEMMGLPEDPEEAFAVYEKMLWTKVEDNTNNTWILERRYVDCLRAFDEVHELGITKEFGDPPHPEDKFGEFFHPFKLHIEASILKMQLSRIKKIKSGILISIKLDASTRKAIRFHVSQIRDTLNTIDIPERKRESLLYKLAAFEQEVDRNRTRFDALMSLAVEVSAAAGEVAENLKPVRDLIDPLFKRVGRAKEEAEALPPPPEKRQIEGPKSSNPPTDLDDDLPF